MGDHENRSKKSAEAMVGARQSAEREGELEGMALDEARHQKPGLPGHTGQRRGEATLLPGRDELSAVRHGREDSGLNLNFSNRLVRTRMPGGVGGVVSYADHPYPDRLKLVGWETNGFVLWMKRSRVPVQYLYKKP